MLKVNIKKILNKEILLYLIFGITVTLLNIILFVYYFNISLIEYGFSKVKIKVKKL